MYPSAVGVDLPFKHRQYFCEKLDDFDYFLFTENDILVTQESVDFIVEKSSLIEHNEIIGFCRYEEKEGVKYFTDYDVGSRLTLHHAWRQSGQVFFTPDSMYSGCYLLSKSQLKRAILSGGYLVSPHVRPYGILEQGSSDIYTQCGFKPKLFANRSCISPSSPE